MALPQGDVGWSAVCDRVFPDHTLFLLFCEHCHKFYIFFVYEIFFPNFREDISLCKSVAKAIPIHEVIAFCISINLSQLH